MNDTLWNVYARLPPFLQSACASAYGYYLNWWRCGKRREEFVRKARERERWSPSQWKAWQEERLAQLLFHAATYVPFYREHWSRRRARGDRSSCERLENWPILEKETVRRNPRAFLSDGCRTWTMYRSHTSGTTNTPLTVWLSRETVQHWYALWDLRCKRWHGVRPHDAWGMLGGRKVARISRNRPPFWMWNRAAKQLYLSVYHLKPDLIKYYFEALRRYQIVYLVGYPSALYTIAQKLLQMDGNDLAMKVVISNAEPLHSWQRETIERAFHCPVRDTYGIAEIAAAASECEEGHLHVWPEVGIIEAQECSAPGGTSRCQIDLLVTGLFNIDMPFIRYRVGDRGQAPSWYHHCRCGRSLPVLPSIEGRDSDVLYGTDGQPIPLLDPIADHDIPVCEAQIIQEGRDRLRVLYVPAAGFAAQHEAAIVRHLQSRVGKMSIVLERCCRLPRGPNGKFRLTICKCRT